MSEKKLFSDYFDIISRQHPTSKKHPRMSNMNRAAQFAPFAALTGYEESIEETARLTDQRIELSNEDISDINIKLNLIKEHIKDRPKVSIIYFQPDERKQGGAYLSATGNARWIDEVNCIIVFDDERNFDINSITHLVIE